MTLVNEYFDLTKKYIKQYGEKTIVLMQVGAFYEVYAVKHMNVATNVGSTVGSVEYRGGDIVAFSNMCDLAIAHKKTNTCENQQVVMSGFRDYQLDKYLEKLEKFGYTTVVYTQDAQGKNMFRSLDKIYSPGTYFSNMTTHKISNNIACVWLHTFTLRNIPYIIIGIANLDIYTGTIRLFENKNEYFHNPTTFNSLEYFFSTYSPSEVIIIHNLDADKYNDVINFANIHSPTVHNIVTNSNQKVINCEKQVYINEILKSTFPSMQEDLNECEIARQAVCYLINFINEHNPDLIKNINNPVFIKDGIYLELENHSLRQLNIIDDKQYTGKLSSMASFLNNCVTSMGKRLFYHNITNPIVCPKKLQAEYNITEYGLQEIDIAHGLNTELLNIKDIEKLNRKIILKTISPFEFYLFYKTLTDFHKITLQVHENDTLKNFLLYKLPDASNIVENICAIATEIETNIDHQAMETRQQHEFPFITQTPNLYYFQPTVDAQLNAKLQLFETSQTIITTIIQKLNQIIRKHESKDSEFVKLHVTEKTPPTLQLTKRRAQILKRNLGNKNIEIPLDDSSESFYNLKVADIKFVSNKNIEIVSSVQINTLCNNLFTVKEEICTLNKKVFGEMLDRFGKYYREFSLFSKYCAYLDIFQNNVRLAHNNNFCKPTVVESPKSFIDATDLRHPLIEKLQTSELYVANTVQIGMPEINQNGILLYGTNAVGKTCLIKSLGIAVIMAQAGLFVPCSAFTFAPYRNIFTRILGNDNMFKGLSTFAVEMSELRTILNKADHNSLILGDELCSGTESDSAMSIFIAGLLDMHEKNCNFIFATHFHDIVNYDEIKNMENLKLYHMTVMYDPEQQKLIYDRKLKSGAGDSMYGLEVCKSLDLPLDFLERAYEIRRKYNKKYNGILSKKTSKYNSKKIIDQCEICKERAADHVHHLQYQQNANSQGFINTFDKNHLANLVSICKECHNSIHKENVEMQIVKTTSGFELHKI